MRHHLKETANLLLKECDVLKRIRTQPTAPLALEYFNSISRSKSFQHTLLTYQTMIHRLGLESQMISVQQLLLEMKLQGLKCSEEIFVTVIRSYSKTRCSSQALDTFHRMLEFGCKPTVKIYNHLLDAMLRDSRFQMIAPIYRDMKRDGIDPNVYTYNIILKALCKNDKIDVAYKLLDEMSSKGCTPDEVSYTTIVSSLSQSGKLTEASDLVTRLPAVIPAYNALINGMCSHRRLKDAVSLMKEIDDRGLQPNVITYTTIINSLCNAGDLRLSLVLFSKMLVKGCTPNTVTLTSLIKGLFAQGKLSEAMEIWDFMVEEPSIITYNVVIHGLCSNGCLPMARSIFSEMEQGNNNHVLPNAGTYSILLRGLSRAGQLEAAMNVWKKMISSGCKVNVVVSTCMVDALSRGSMFDDANRLIRTMRLPEWDPPNIVTYNAFIRGLCGGGRVDWAMMVLRELNSKQPRYVLPMPMPNVTTYNHLLYGLCCQGSLKKSFDLAHEMACRGIRFDLVTYNTLIYGVCLMGMLKEALLLVGKMAVNGVQPDIVTWNTLIASYCKIGNVMDGVRILKAGNCHADVFTYTSIIFGFCNGRRIDDAISYLEKMSDEGICPNTATWNVLVRGILQQF